MINQDQLWRLFDLVPGLDYCELKRSDNRHNRDRHSNKSVGSVVFNNPQSATYAKEKLHGFEYPPGHRLIVKFEEIPAPGYNVAPPSHYNMNHAPRPQQGYLQPRPAPPRIITATLSNITTGARGLWPRPLRATPWPPTRPR